MLAMDIPNQISSMDELLGLFRPPAPRPANKVFDTIDEASSRFIQQCSFLVLATTDGKGSIDCSPRGGPRGFLQQLDDRHVAIPDLVGNNRIDSLRNLISNPLAGLLLVVAGKEETLRINGPSVITTDTGILSGFGAGLRTPKLAIVVETAELYGHCAKAFRRGRVWDPRLWADVEAAPDLAEIYGCQFSGIDVGEMRETVEALYSEELSKD